MKAKALNSLAVDGKRIDYRVVPSKTAKKLRVRVGENGVEVIRPRGRSATDVDKFIESSRVWIADQVDRIERIGPIRRRNQTPRNAILFRGKITPIQVEVDRNRGGVSRVLSVCDSIVIRTSKNSVALTTKTLENWLRKQARLEVLSRLDVVTTKLHKQPNRIYIRGQRTKWGSCSSKKNLSFNWRLIMAPEYVLEYIVIHEAVHLAVPNHSHKFWLMVQSLCPNVKRAKDWLTANGQQLIDGSVKDSFV